MESTTLYQYGNLCSDLQWLTAEDCDNPQGIPSDKYAKCDKGRRIKHQANILCRTSNECKA